MKNIFVTANYDVKVMYAHDGHTEPGDYKQLTNICTESFRDNLVGLDEVVILSGSVDNFHQLFKEIYWKIREIWHKSACNIIWSDSDNLCLKPLDIFGKWDKFSMFFSANEYKDCFVYGSSLTLTKNLIPWMMANLRYYPAEMDQKLWEIGDDLAYSWIEEWGYECIIYNKMFHSQGITDFKKYHIPAWNVQCEGPVGMVNPEVVRDSTIIHCQSTRGSREAIEKMERALKFKLVLDCYHRRNSRGGSRIALSVPIWFMFMFLLGLLAGYLHGAICYLIMELKYKNDKIKQIRGIVEMKDRYVVKKKEGK